MSQLLLTKYFKIETIKEGTATPEVRIELKKPARKPVQQSLVRCGATVVINGEDVSDQFVDTRKRGGYSSREVVPLVYRRAFSDELFRNNKVSDEYYTGAISWYRFLHTFNLIGQRVFEPFFADGSSSKELKALVDVVGRRGANFWDIYKDPEFDGLLILSNPPFSFKWQVIITLLEQRRNFALILPWETFCDKKNADKTNVVEECPLVKYQQRFGGKYMMFKMYPEEQFFFHPNDDGTLHSEGRSGTNIQIGTHILYWRFDGDFTTNKVVVLMHKMSRVATKRLRVAFNRLKKWNKK
jgi:hypothetical protein